MIRSTIKNNHTSKYNNDARTRERTMYLMSILAIISLWQLQSMRVANDTLFPSPAITLDALLRITTQKDTYLIIGHSLFRLLISVSIASIVGVSIGLIAGVYQRLAFFLTPIVSALRSLPVASLIVVILILYGREASIYIIGFLMVFPIIFEATKHGVLNINSNILDALLLENIPIWKKILLMYLPLSVPFVKTGFLQSIGLGFKVLVVSEFIAQTDKSLGRMLYISRINIAYDDVFAWTIIVILLVIMSEIFINKFNKKTSDSLK